MTGKQTAGILCCILAALLFVAGIVSFMTNPGPGLTDASGLGISRAVGSLLPGTVALIIGVWLLGKKS